MIGGHAGGELVASHGGGRARHCVGPGCTGKSLGGGMVCDGISRDGRKLKF